MEIPGRLSRVLMLAALFSVSLRGASPQVWFAPLDPYTRQNNVTLGIIPSTAACCSDFMNLFATGSQWPQAAANVAVFKLYASLVNRASDTDLRQIFSFLNRQHIEVAIEFGPLIPSGGCGVNSATGYGVEGFSGAGAQAIVAKLQANGGTLKYVAMDEPFYYGNIYNGPGACHWSPQQIATNALASLNVLKAAFPGLMVGDIEVVPASDLASDWLQRYAAWMDAFQAATGSKLAFFHSDTGFNPTWMLDVMSVKAETSKRGIPLGIIYNGLRNDFSDFAWLARAQQHFTDFELSNGQPDQAIFQSWTAYPMTSLPETTPYTFAWLIDQYTRPRTSLSLTPALTQATGKLVDSAGQGIASAPITVTLQPTAGPGIVSNYALTGTVPSSAMTALVGLRTNKECSGCAGDSDLVLYSFKYSEGTGTTNAATLDFSQGLKGWGLFSTGIAQLEQTTVPPGQALHVSALPTQVIQLNSSSFSVTPGASYTVRIVARVAPKALGSGYFTVIFLADKEVSRDTLPYAPGSVTLGTTQTGSDGTYNLQFARQSPGAFQIQASYPGIDYPAANALWPALASSPFDIVPSIKPNGVVNAANFKSEPLSPGAWFTIFGRNLGQAGQWTTPSTFTLGGASVSVCGVQAAISFNSGSVTTNGVVGWQLNALMPDGIAGQTSCPVVVTVDGQASQPANVSIASGILELFGFTSAAGSLPIITHADYSLVGPSSAGLNPAKPGESVIAWGTGDCSPPTVTVGGNPAVVLFSGRVAPGLCQLNFVVPDSPAGANELKVSTSPNSYTIWVEGFTRGIP